MRQWRDVLRSRLEASTVFGSLDEEVREALVKAARLRKGRAGQYIWRMGTRADELAVVLAGTLEVSRGSAARRRMVFRVLGPGDIVGFSTVAGELHTADLRAGRGLTLAAIPGRSLRRLFKDRPEVALHVIAELGHLVGLLTDENASLRNDSLESRVRMQLSHHGPHDAVLRVTHEELAAQVAATRSRVSNVLKRMERAGELRLGRGWIEIRDLHPEGSTKRVGG